MDMMKRKMEREKLRRGWEGGSSLMEPAPSTSDTSRMTVTARRRTGRGRGRMAQRSRGTQPSILKFVTIATHRRYLDLAGDQLTIEEEKGAGEADKASILNK